MVIPAAPPLSSVNLVCPNAAGMRDRRALYTPGESCRCIRHIPRPRGAAPAPQIRFLSLKTGARVSPRIPAARLSLPPRNRPPSQILDLGPVGKCTWRWWPEPRQRFSLHYRNMMLRTFPCAHDTASDAALPLTHVCRASVFLISFFK